jgi:hypothetical protein
MAKTITITGIRINAIRIERDDENNVTVTADYQYTDADGVMPEINLQVNSETKPIGQYTAAQRDALIALNDYVEARILAAEGI